MAFGVGSSQSRPRWFLPPKPQLRISRVTSRHALVVSCISILMKPPMVLIASVSEPDVIEALICSAVVTLHPVNRSLASDRSTPVQLTSTFVPLPFRTQNVVGEKSAVLPTLMVLEPAAHPVSGADTVTPSTTAETVAGKGNATASGLAVQPVNCVAVFAAQFTSTGAPTMGVTRSCGNW